MVDVFEQVEEELRSDRYTRLARTWLPVLGGVLLIALVAALGWWGWTSWQVDKSEKASVVYERGLQSLQSGDKAAADSAFAQVEKMGSAAYKPLALMERAAIAQANGKAADAAALFDEAAKSTREPIISDAAALKAVLALMDTAPLADIEARLQPIMKEGRPYRAYAQEALGMARLQHGQTRQAREPFVLLSLGQDVPDDMRQRAQTALDAIDTGLAASLPDIVKAQGAMPPPAQPAAAPAGQEPTQAPAPEAAQ